MKEKEVYCYAPVMVTFKELGYRSTTFEISGDTFRCEFRLINTSIDSIVIAILRFCSAYEIKRDELIYQTSKELFNSINLKTLSNSKTVWQLFEEQGIQIKEIE